MGQRKSTLTFEPVTEQEPPQAVLGAATGPEARVWWIVPTAAAPENSATSPSELWACPAPFASDDNGAASVLSPELRRIAELATCLCGARSAAVALLNPRGQRAVLWVGDAPGSFNPAAGVAAPRQPANRDLLELDVWVLAAEAAAMGPVYIPDANEDTRSSGLATVEDGRLGFFACAPFFSSAGRWMGALCCLDCNPREEVGDAQRQALEYLAEQAQREAEAMAAADNRTSLDGAGTWRALSSCDLTPCSDDLPGSGSLCSCGRYEALLDRRSTPLGTPRSSVDGSRSGRCSFSGSHLGGGRRAPFPAGEELPQLRLGAVLGAGSFGRVYIGTFHGAPVACKVLETAAHRGAAAGAALEAELSMSLSHPNVVRTLAWHQAAGQTSIVLDYMDQGTLQSAIDAGRLREGGSLSLLAALATAREVASGMAYLHMRGVLHCDLTASNVLLSGRSAGATDGRGFVAQVSDFGLSCVLAPGESSLVVADTGASAWMAPEVVAQGLVSRAADVYSFGVLLWSICTGQRPWEGLTQAVVIHEVCVKRRQLEFPAGDDIPECLKMVARACMAHDPASRPSFDDVLEILHPLGQLILGA